jgi:hypothetical protein
MAESGSFFWKKEAKTFVHFGFGLSGWAQPSFAKVFWFFFSKKNGFLPRGRAWRFHVPPAWAVTSFLPFLDPQSR